MDNHPLHLWWCSRADPRAWSWKQCLTTSIYFWLPTPLADWAITRLIMPAPTLGVCKNNLKPWYQRDLMLLLELWAEVLFVCARQSAGLNQFEYTWMGRVIASHSRSINWWGLLRWLAHKQFRASSKACKHRGSCFSTIFVVDYRWVKNSGAGPQKKYKRKIMLATYRLLYLLVQSFEVGGESPVGDRK